MSSVGEGKPEEKKDYSEVEGFVAADAKRGVCLEFALTWRP